MLDDEEWSVVQTAFRAGDRAPSVLEDIRRARGISSVLPPTDRDLRDRRLWALVAGYQLFTGIAETNANAVWHHVASLYGPPCTACGKPLRTPAAKLCAACGTFVERGVAPA